MRYDVFVFTGLFADYFWETFPAVVEYDSIQIFGDRIDRAFLWRVTANGPAEPAEINGLCFVCLRVIFDIAPLTRIDSLGSRIYPTRTGEGQ